MQNRCNIVGQQLPTLLDVTCCVSLLHVVACWCVLLGVAAQSLKVVKHLNQQLPAFLLFHDCRSGIATMLESLMHSSSSNVGVTHAVRYPWSPWRSINVSQYCLLNSLNWSILCHNALQVPTLLGVRTPVRTISKSHATPAVLNRQSTFKVFPQLPHFLILN